MTEPFDLGLYSFAEVTLPGKKPRHTGIAGAQSARPGTGKALAALSPRGPLAAVQNAAVRRALVTVVKADISGSTPLAEKLDPEELRGVLSTYFGALAREIQRHGGLVDKYIGDAVMAVFGLPDCRRA